MRMSAHRLCRSDMYYIFTVSVFLINESEGASDNWVVSQIVLGDTVRSSSICQAATTCCHYEETY